MQTILAVFRDCSVPGSVNLGTKGTCSKFSSLDFMPCFARFSRHLRVRSILHVCCRKQ